MFDINFLSQDNFLANLLNKSNDLAINKLNHRYLCSHHFLYILAKEIEASSMNLQGFLDTKEIDVELNRLNYAEIEPSSQNVMVRDSNNLNGSQYREFSISQPLINIIKSAKKYALFFNEDKINEYHILLSVLENDTSLAFKSLEATGINVYNLNYSILLSISGSWQNKQQNFKESLLAALKKIIDWYITLVDNVSDLGLVNSTSSCREEISYLVMNKYLSQFLELQLSLLRFTLEHNLKVIDKQIGSLTPQIQSSIISRTAQNLRSQVKEIIEYMFSHECHLFQDMPNESEYEQISLIIEDLWWSYGEAIALEDLYSLAIEDHRRKHLLDLQKNKLATYQKLSQLKEKLRKLTVALLKNHPVLKLIKD